MPPDNLASCHEIVAISIIHDAAQNPLLRHQAYKGMWCWAFDHLKGAVPISISCLQIICLGHPRSRSTEWSTAHTALTNVLNIMHTCTPQSTALPFSTLFLATIVLWKRMSRTRLDCCAQFGLHIESHLIIGLQGSQGGHVCFHKHIVYACKF